MALGPKVERFLRPVRTDDAEIQRRVEEVLERLKEASKPGVLRAAVHLLGERRPSGTAEMLLAYASFVSEESVVEELWAALALVARRDGKAEPAVVAALQDASGPRRTAAAVALARAGAVDQRTATRKLLRDSELTVRWPVARALAMAQDREAIPVLIDLIGLLPPEQGGQVDEILRVLAGEQAPEVILGQSRAERDKCRDSWKTWWQTHEKTANLARLNDITVSLGYTLIVQWDNNPQTGRVFELDRNNKVRWQITDIPMPVDAQVLPGNRVLIGEYATGRITERNFKGEILWHATGLPALLSVQRLANGNTFAASRNRLVELDRTGKVVFSHTQPRTNIHSARKLSDGKIVLLTTNRTCVRLNAAGTELGTFSVGPLFNCYHSQFDARPNGRVLVPDYIQNQVVEYDGDGKAVWKVPVTRPTCAMFLPSGNVLVASMLQRRIVELDRQGKEVWQYSVNNAQLVKAYRR